MFSFTLFVASPSWGTWPGFVVGWEVEGRRMWCLSDNLTVHVWRRNDIWSCGTANAIFQVRNEMHSVQILCYSRSASLQSMASALVRYIKKITAPFNNTRTLKFKAQPTNAFFATVNQMFADSSQLSTAAERAVIKSLCRVQTTNRVRQ